MTTTGTSSTQSAASATAFRLPPTRGGLDETTEKAYTTSRCRAPLVGQRLWARSGTTTASTASDLGSP